MTTLPPLELLVTGDRVTIPVPVAPPVLRGSATACLSASRGGPAVAPALERTLVWQRGEPIPPLTLFARDLRAVWPRGGRAWLVVRYAGQLVSTSEVRVVVG